MNPHNEILRLFKSFSDKEKHMVLKELNETSTNTMVRHKDSTISYCPHCGSKLFVKNGHRGIHQNYKCKACCKVFTSKTGTSLHGLHKPEKFELYKSLMLEVYYPIKKIARKVRISIQTAFDWRHKILAGAIEDDKSFEGVTEIDDIWFFV